jgi:hypothetical protein
LGDTPQALRDLSVSLNKVGNVERELGNLSEGLAAYRQSLGFLRQRWAMLGNTKPVLEELCNVLEKTIDLELRAGDPEIASSLQREMGEIDAMLSVWRQGNGDAEELLSND